MIKKETKKTNLVEAFPISIFWFVSMVLALFVVEQDEIYHHIYL